MFTIPIGFFGGFNPLSVPDCQCWLRSDLGVTVTGAGVSTWANQAPGVSADGTQGTDARRPTYTASGGLNNRPYLTFNGSKALQWALDLQGAKTVFAVVKLSSHASAGNFYSIYSMKGSTGPVFSEGIEINSVASYFAQTWISDVSSGAVAAVGAYPFLSTAAGHILIQGYDGGAISTTSSYSVLYDGLNPGVAASGAFARTLTDLGSLGGRVDSLGAVSFGLVGDYYEIAVWDRELTSAEMTALYDYARGLYAVASDYSGSVLGSTPAGYWRLADPSGTTADDASGNNIDGTYQNSWMLSQPESGALLNNDSVVSAAANSYIEITGDPAGLQFEYTGGFTLECWLKIPLGQSVAAQPIVLGKLKTSASAPSLRGYMFQINNATTINFAAISTYNTNLLYKVATLPIGAINDGAWHHLVMVYTNATTLDFYFDAVLCSMATSFNTLSDTIDNAVNARFFNYEEGAQMPSGVFLDEVAFYPSALSAATILTHYRASGNGL